ncbi:2-hydroxyacid dehydrogenase [Echinicola jeungdonensis]|uniref:2-hydroxyacid dehydrogenase n=1 Tax=Echinicola jeungdonensis TaxID=709343 RepID=A0ABV5J970_9BACT|nr:2-hydroxyacid dehydrogenase [Echinicola jeungdonensis]MDN3670520.1 2-hydroxyacid dehydrogenase [Echinicola jeungdonensis]
MKVTVFSTHKFEREFLNLAIQDHQLHLLETKLTLDTASLAAGSEAVSIFVNDDASGPVLQKLKEVGVKFLALRSAGYNHVDLQEANHLGIKVARVPEYSPAAIAEHTVAIMLGLNRKLIKAHNRVRDLNFSLDGLVGFDMEGKTVGVIGTGKIGSKVIRILHGFGCRILAFDPYENKDLKNQYQVQYVDLDTLCKESDIISLHLPLTKESKYLINEGSILQMKQGVMVINTSRGGLVNTVDVIQGLKTGKIGSFGIDVYEEEAELFFEDHSEDILQDDVIARLMTFQNVLITSHQAFLTKEALTQIAATTSYNLNCWENLENNPNELVFEEVKKP